MPKKIIILFVFILVALVQLYVTAKEIIDREMILSTGKEYKFQIAPVDPVDPLRGKYVILNFKQNAVPVDNDKDWSFNEPVYVLLETGPDGYAKIRSISKTRPPGNPDYVKATINFISNDILTIEYPFDRFYMEESKAPRAEKEYLRTLRDTTQAVYALVNIKKGKAVIKDVLINGVSIRDIIYDEPRNREGSR